MHRHLSFGSNRGRTFSVDATGSSSSASDSAGSDYQSQLDGKVINDNKQQQYEKAMATEEQNAIKDSLS